MPDMVHSAPTLIFSRIEPSTARKIGAINAMEKVRRSPGGGQMLSRIAAMLGRIAATLSSIGPPT
jgi:hypothetical protein